MLNFSIPELYHGISTYIPKPSSSRLIGNIFLELYCYMPEFDFYLSLDDSQPTALIKGLQLHYFCMMDRINGFIHPIGSRRCQWYDLWNLSFSIGGEFVKILKTVLRTVRTTCGMRVCELWVFIFSGDAFTLSPNTFPSLQVIYYFFESLSHLWEVSLMI